MEEAVEGGDPLPPCKGSPVLTELVDQRWAKGDPQKQRSAISDQPSAISRQPSGGQAHCQRAGVKVRGWTPDGKGED